jgi:hypothetical protein
VPSASGTHHHVAATCAQQRCDTHSDMQSFSATVPDDPTKSMLSRRMAATLHAPNLLRKRCSTAQQRTREQRVSPIGLQRTYQSTYAAVTAGLGQMCTLSLACPAHSNGAGAPPADTAQPQRYTPARRGPLDDIYVRQLVLQQRKHLIIAGACRTFAVVTTAGTS